MPPPPPLPDHARINLADLKSQIARKLGLERAQRYFGCLNRLLAQKVSKPEFNKLCGSILGRELVPLHNQLIRSILKNACHAKVPPSAVPVHDNGASRHVGGMGKVAPQEDSESNPSSASASAQLPPVWSNGDALPLSPRKSRSNRDRKIKDRPRQFGPNHQSLAASDGNAVGENGFLSLCDLKRIAQQLQDRPAEQPVKRQRIEIISTHDRASVQSKGVVEAATAEDGEEWEYKNDSKSSRLLPLRAPLGIPFCHASVGGARRSSELTGSSNAGGFSSSYDSGELCHTEALKNRMERIAEAHGLGGVSMDCANLLNNGLDVYLKRLINASVELVGARAGHESIKLPVYKQQPHGKPINDVLPGSHMHVQKSSRPSEGVNELIKERPISLHDFKVAMELNPQQLGEDWPLLLEKICVRSFEE